MIEEKDINLSVSDEVIDFINCNIQSLDLDDPVPSLIFGRFPDEEKENFRVALREKTDIENNSNGKGIFVKVKSLPGIFIPNEFEKIVLGKTMILVGDIVEFK